MISRSDWEPLPKPTLSPFARGYLSLCRFFTAAVWCVPALRVPLVHSLINHFRQKRVSSPGPVAHYNYRVAPPSDILTVLSP